MLKNRRPVNIPEPLRGIEPGSFAESTIRIRLKAIGQRIVQENKFTEPVTTRLTDLLEDLPFGKIRLLRDQNAPDSTDWQAYTQPYLSMSWLEVPWFFAETYFYRRVLEATGYFSAGEGSGFDPYQTQKRLGFASNLPAIRAANRAAGQWAAEYRGHSSSRTLDHILALSLWGNQADLSMWPAADDVDDKNRPVTGSFDQEAGLLVDDRDLVRTHLISRQLPRLDMILDNSGLELVHDLLAVELLLRLNIASQVVLHAKAHPTFVSDTVRADIQDTLVYLGQVKDSTVIQASENLQELINSGQLVVKEDFYWNSPLAFWDAPIAIMQELGKSDLVISKGDANYRRFLGDRHWPYTTQAREALGYLPFPFLALRVSKSEVVVGLQPEQVKEMASRDPDWMVDGNWGMIQFNLT